MPRDKEKQRANWRRWYRLHKTDQDKKVYFNRSKRKQTAKAWITEYKKTLECKNCGNDNPVVLDFHHRDPSTKEFEISTALRRTQSIDRLKKEIEKCDVLCANCHRIEHDKIKRRSLA